MSSTDELIEILLRGEDPDRETGNEFTIPEDEEIEETTYAASPDDERMKFSKNLDFTLSGLPTYGIKWDEIGLGLIKPLGFLPLRAVKITVKDGKWIFTGARTSSSILIFLALGAGGTFYFLQDIVSQINNWGEIIGLVIVLVPTLLNFIIRSQTLEFLPFELEFLGYDSENKTLVISTVAEPSGVVALKVELPDEARALQYEESKLVQNLQKAHTGFMRIDGMIKYDYSRIRYSSLWWLIWIVVIYLFLTLGVSPWRLF